jgi:gamma-glutamyltranspeptidase/glutathione hydrolase
VPEALSSYVRNPGPKTPATGLKAAVTTDNAIVTGTMMKVLKAGGKAADAAIAGAMAQAAVEPFMTNHAGLVTFLYFEAKTGRLHQLDSLGAHPSGLAPFRPIPPGTGAYASALSPSAIIPGFMPGLKEIHKRFGTLAWSDLCADAVTFAESGHVVSTFEYGVNIFGEKFVTYFPEGRAFYQPNGYFPNVGEVFKSEGLGQTLRGVADDPDYMITGAWAKAFVKKANEMGWRITPEHMTETPPRWVEPSRFKHHEYEIVCLGPPQAQGFFTGVAMGVLRHLGVRDMAPGSADHFWAMGHALRQGARHWEYAQDEAIYGIPSDEVLDDGYHAHLAKMIRIARPKVDLTDQIRLAGDAVGGADFMSALGGGGGKPRLMKEEEKQPTGSCEIAVVDADGNWVQMMDTLQGSGIPGMVIGGVPMVGSHATFGHLQSPMDATLVKGAKGRCIIGNTLVLKDGVPVFSAGSRGNIHCTLPQVLTYLLDFKLDPYAAVDAPRMLPMTESRTVVIEDRLKAGTVEDLHKLGIRVGVVSGYDYHMGSYSVIARSSTDGTLTAVADPRRTAVADGIKA